MRAPLAAAAAALVLCAAPARAETYTLTGNQAFSIEQGLMKLSGYDKVVKDGNDEKVVSVAYEGIGSGMRLLIAGDIAAIEAQLNVARAAVKAETVSTTDKAKIDAVAAKIFDEPRKIELEPVDFKQLNLDVNPIPASVLALVMPISVKPR